MSEKSTSREEQTLAQDAVERNAANHQGMVPENPESPSQPEGLTSHEENGSQKESEEVSIGKEEYEELVRKAEDQARYLNELQRTKADFINFQKRIRRDRPGWEAQAARRVIEDLLPVVDNFERALEAVEGVTLESLVEGVRMIHQMVLKVLESHDVKQIDALGKPFDPQFHDANHQVETTDPDKHGTVVEVLQKGYTHGDTVVRPSKVAVAKNVPAQKDGTPAEEEGAAEEIDH